MLQRFKPATIIVDRQTIHSNNATISLKYGTIPMLKVLTHLGASVTWLDGNNAIITYKNIILSLSVSKMELLDQHGRNYFDNPPGNQYYFCQYIDREIMLDDCTMYAVLFYLGIKTEITLNYANREILIRKT